MGAWKDEGLAAGRTLHEAFAELRARREAEHGHQQGYSGTFASKYEAVAVPVPAGMRATRFFALLEDADTHLHADPEWSNKAEVNAAARFWRQAGPHAAALRHAAEIVNDKRGPALAVELTGQAALDAKKRLHVAGRRGIHVWRVIGYCPS